MTIAAAPPRAGNPLAVAGIVLAGVLLVLGLLTRVLSLLLPSIVASTGSSVSAMSAVLSAFGILSLVVGLVTAGLGIAALTRRGRPRALAGAATAIGALAVLTFVLGEAGTAVTIAMVTPR